MRLCILLAGGGVRAVFISDYHGPCTVWVSLQVDTVSCKGVWSADSLAAGWIFVLVDDSNLL